MIMVSEAEREIRKGEERMTGDDVEDLSVHADVFTKYLKKKANEYQALLGLGKMQNKESEAYLAFKIIDWLIEWLKKSEDNYKELMKEGTK